MHTKNRVTGMVTVKASQLVPHEKNFRTHSTKQRATLRGMLDEVGFAGAIITRMIEDDKYQIIDGHLRAEISGDEDIPIVVTDLSENEAKKVLATYDAIGGMADFDKDILEDLMSGIEFDNENISKMLNDMLDNIGEKKDDDLRYLEDFDATPKQKPAWILISVPTDKAALILNELSKWEDDPSVQIEMSNVDR